MTREKIFSPNRRYCSGERGEGMSRLPLEQAVPKLEHVVPLRDLADRMGNSIRALIKESKP
jgi:hypothetical protein